MVIVYKTPPSSPFRNRRGRGEDSVFLRSQPLRPLGGDLEKATHDSLPDPLRTVSSPASQMVHSNAMSRASEQAYAKIRAHLLSGEVQPNEQLTEDQLAYNVTR